MRPGSSIPEISIAGRAVGPGHPCYIIAEAGSNHDRDLAQAHALVDAAAEARVDAVKFQAFVADEIAADTKHPVAQIDFAGAKTLHELYAKAEMPREWLPELQVHAVERGLDFLCTPFDVAAADRLEALGAPAFKVASFELLHIPLLRRLGQLGKPVILSTGMATLREVELALSTLREAGGEQVVLLQCTSTYPADPSDANLRAMATMAAAFQVPVGYSDHTLGIAVPIAAATLGASVIEKHYTTDRGRPGPDHAFALEPGELAAMVEGVRAAEAALGSPCKGPTEAERTHRLRGRRSLFAKVAIPAGATITAEMISVLRPGVGISPEHLDIVVGRVASKPFERLEPLTWEKL